MKSLTRGTMAAVVVLAAIVAPTGPAVAAPPVPSTVMTCAKLQSATDPAAAFDRPVALHYAAGQDIYYQPSRLPRADIIRMAGGLECQWSGGGELDMAPDLDDVGVLVQFLPAEPSATTLRGGDRRRSILRSLSAMGRDTAS
jgi:hypothetical protein